MSPRTDPNAVTAEGRELPAIEPETQVTPAPVADAPDTTTAKQKHDDPQKLDQSGDPGAEKTGGEGSGGKGSKGGRS